MTAAHVLKGAISDAEKSGLKVGVVCKDENGNSSESIIAKLLQYEIAPRNADIAIGLTAYRGPTKFELSVKSVEVWQDVGTYGYPQETISGPANALRLNLRAHKGYIQRIVNAGDVFASPESVGFELSFLLARGLSGGPLFIHDEPFEKVIGVCVGSYRSEVLEDEIVEVQRDGREYREKRVSISQYGLAETIEPLLQWKPLGFGGLTLAQISALH